MSRKIRSTLLLALVAAFTGSGLPAARAATFVVNSTADRPDPVAGDGLCDTGEAVDLGGGALADECTLRAAIQEANALPGKDLVHFAANLEDGTGTAEIALQTPLPPIVDPIEIDGTTAPGYAAADPFATPVIGIDGQAIPGTTPPGLSLQSGADDSVILALAVYGFDDGIQLIPGAGNYGPNFVRVQGCQIGVRGGILYPGNRNNGVHVEGSDWTVIGVECNASGCTGKGNVIAASRHSGIYSDSWHGQFAGNRIGTDVSGSSNAGPFGDLTRNENAGVWIEGSLNTIGGVLPEAGNLISGNWDDGVHLTGDLNKVLSNHIGTDHAGTVALPNFDYGVKLDGTENRVGGADLDGNLLGGNVIAANLLGGVLDEGGNEILGNVIGLSPDHSAAVGSQPVGIDLRGNFSMVEGNTLGASQDEDILVGGFNNYILDNHIGTNGLGEDFGTAAAGIRVTGDGAFIGIAGGGNVLGFHEDEIVLEPDSEFARVQGNWIGVHPDGTPMGATSEGIEVRGDGHVIGGAFGLSDGSGNVIGYNFDGIEVFGGALENAIEGNYIGTDATGADLGNLDDGIDISGAVKTSVGALPFTGNEATVAFANVIAFNDGVGVSVTDSASEQNSVRGNEFFGNGLGAIDIFDNGPTPNDALDSDHGPNRVINFPEFDLAQTAVNPVTGDLDVVYRVMTTVASAAFPLIVDFYLSTGNDGQPDTFFGSALYESGDATLWDFATISAPEGVFPHGLLVASVTDADGNTSELSNQFVFLPEPGATGALACGAGLLWGLARRRLAHSM